MQSEHRKAVEKEVSEGRSRSQGDILRVVIEHEVQPITKQKQLQASADGSWLQSSASMCCVLHRSEMSAPQCWQHLTVHSHSAWLSYNLSGLALCCLFCYSMQPGCLHISMACYSLWHHKHASIRGSASATLQVALGCWPSAVCHFCRTHGGMQLHWQIQSKMM